MLPQSAFERIFQKEAEVQRSRGPGGRLVRLLGRVADAEDIVQEAFLRLQNAMDQGLTACLSCT